jgi:hypothetical protein
MLEADHRLGKQVESDDPGESDTQRGADRRQIELDEERFGHRERADGQCVAAPILRGRSARAGTLSRMASANLTDRRPFD